MGFGGISVWQLVIILIVFLLTLIAAPVWHAHRSGKRDEAGGDAPADNKDKAPASHDQP